MHTLTNKCSFEIRDGKVFCTLHSVRHTAGMSEAQKKAMWDWAPHESHKKEQLGFRHILFTATRCVPCNQLLLDEEQ